MKTNQLFERLWEHGRTLRRVGLVLVMCLTLCLPNVWGASVAEGTYNWVNQTISAKNEFYKIDNGIYQYRLNGYSKNSSLGIQLPSGTGDGTGFAFHLESTQKVYIGIVKKSVKREVTNNLYIKTITEANFSAIEAGSNSSTTVTLTLGGSATLSGNYTFAAISNAKTEGATVYMGELPAGYYYAYGNSSNGEGYLYSITFGTQTLFLVPNDKTSDNAKFAIYYWMGATGYERQGWSDYMTVSPCNSSTYRADIPKGYTKVIFVRLNPSGGRNWDSKWNKTGDLTFDGSKDLFTWANGSWDDVTTTWSASTKYTISFAANGGTGSMSNVSSIACGRSVKLAANAYTKSGYVFAGWKTNVAVTANGEAVAANGIVADEATISNITSNITLTAQWNADVACTATQPGALNKGTLSGCSRTITASGSAATNNTWYWQSSASGTDKSDAYSSGKAITETGTYYLRSFCSDGAGCWSDAVQVTITAADMTPAAPTALAKSSITAKGVTLTVTDAANTNNYDFYVSTSSTAPSAGTSASYTSTSKSVTITDKYAGTTFYAWARAKCGSNKSAWTALGDGGTFTTSTVSAAYHLANVSKTSGAESGIGGSTFSAVFSANTDYSMPTPVVTIGGNAATSGTDYTWTEGTGTLTIAKEKITGNIDITLNSVPSAPSNAVISGTYHYFPGDNISLTCTPSGNNGPTTYQWYKGGKADGNRIDGATSATYTKNSCAFADAGSYYCKVTCNETSIWANTNSYENYDVKILRLYVNGSKSGEPYGNVDFTKVDGTTATASIALGSGWTYGFNIADGCGHYYGNAGTMQENNCTNWTTNVNGTDCGLTTTNAATYIFTINYSSLEAIVTSVTYPVGNQAADKVIYFDNNVLKWTGSSIYYRIGHSSHSQASQLSLVPGTANLYKMTTTEYNGFSGWHIANATGDVGSGKSIYKTVDGTPITEATAHEGGAVTQKAITVTPTTSKGYGADVGVNDNCEFYNYTITNGMKTDAVSITAPSNGTITVAYTDVAGASQSFTSGSENLAHTVIITPTATPATGYDLGGLTVNAVAHTSGNTYTCSGATTIAATFSPHVYTITYKDQGNVAFSGTHADGYPTSHTYGTATTLKGATKTGYTFGGWFGNPECTGDAMASVGATSYSTNFTLYAKWTAKEYTVTLDRNGASSGSESVTMTYNSSSHTAITAPVKAGYTFDGWYDSETDNNGSGNLVMNASGVLQANVTGFTGADGIWTKDATCTLYAKWTAKQTTITIDANTGNHGSSTPGNVTATFGSALPSFTAAAGVSGWNLTGYFTAPTSGTKVINADGTLVASTDYADGSAHWKYETASLTLYPQYEEAEAGCVDANSTNFGEGNSSGDASKTLDDGTVVAMYKCTNSASSVSIGGNILFTAPTGKAFETFSFVATCGSDSKTNYYKINGGSQQNLESSTTTSKRYTITVPASPNTTTIQIIKNGTTPAVTEFCYTYKDVCTTPATAFANGAYTVGGSALDLSTLISGKQGSGAITYTVKNANGTGASIDGSNFTATSAGTATVTATQAADATYCEKVMDATITVSAGGGYPAGYIYITDVKATPETGASGVTATGGSYDNSLDGSFSHDGYTKWFQTSGASGYYQLNFSPALDVSTYTDLKVDLWWGVNVGSNRATTVYVNGTSVGTMQVDSKTRYQVLELSDLAVTATSISSIKIEGGGGGANSVFFRVGVKGTPATPCTVAPTVSATTTGATTSTTQVVNCSGISSLGTGTCTITSYGFVYGTSANPTLSDSHVEVGTSYTVTGTAFAETTLTGLTPSTTYYVRAYATNGAGTGYGDAVSFTTSATPVGAPVITVQPTLSEVALGETASFSLTATGATSYQWYSCDSEGENKTEASGASAATASYSYTTTATGTTYYICKVSNASGDTWSDVVGSIVTPATFTVKYTAGSTDGKTYDLAGGANDFTQGHEAVSEVADKFSNWSNYTFTGVGISGSAKKGTMSMLISMPTAYDADKYVSFHFDLAANYQLQLTNVNLQVQAKDNVGQSFKFVISDEYGHSYTKEVASLGQTGKLVQIGGDISETTKFVGTITLKLYGWYSSTDYYRLAKEVTITGEVSSLPAPTASWTARPASATVGDGGKTYTLTTDGTNTVAWSITDQSGATDAALSPTSGLTTTLGSYTTAGSLYVQASVRGDGIHYLSTPATLLRQRVVISGDCSETTLISATLSSGTATGSVTGTPGGTSAVSFTSVKEVDGGYKMGGDGSYVYLTLSGDENFAANDEVKITITKASDQGDGALHIYKYASSAWTELGSVVAAGAGTYSYTLTETNVSTAFNTIGLYRTEKNQNPYVKALSVVRNSCSASKPSGVTVTASAAGPYAINDALTLTVTATNADTYQWYSNTNNTASDGFLLVGETATTYSPSTAIAGTTYYYCVATNTSGSTVSNIITVTVNSAKTAPTVSWTDTYETPNYGGGGYAVKATVSTAEWDGTLTTDMLTASDGVTLTGVSVSGKVITATYGVTETARSPLSFSLTLPETTNYTALAANKEITFTRCGEGAVIETTETKLPVKSSYTTASNPTYRWETAGVGWLTLVTGSSTLSSTSDSYEGFSYRSNSGKSSITFYSELDAVSAVRIYIKGGGSTTLSKVQKGTTFGKYTQLAPSTDYDYSYSNGSSSIESREQAYIEITFKTALSANTFVEITLSRNTEYYGVGLITGNSEVGNITTALSWATDPGTTVNKYTTDANFRYEAEKASDAASQATLGTISYKSSVPAVATVSATGVVDILSAGSTTITATLASSGCYKKATLSYNLVVAAATCTDVAGTITASGSGITIDGNTVTKADACAAVTLTVSGHTGEDAGATYQWYKDGESLGGSFQTKSISVTDNGDYTVEVTNAGVEHCTMPATNTITITGNAISITKIVDEWYVKNDRRTPDIALATIEGTTSYTVNDGSSNITTFAGCGFELRDGILYLKGTQDDGSAPSGLAAGDVTLTITAVSACGDDPTATITIHKQVKTAKSSIAFIVDGTKGDPVNSVATTKTSSRPLWVYLSTYFDLTGCNAYWTNNEKLIRQYYSQFDAIVITDDPSTDEKPKSGLKYVNALGTMVDVRPILTMEAYVGKYGASSNWHIGGTPSSPNPRQYELKLQCKDHDIFSDLTPSANFRSEEIGGETYYYVTMVDNSVTPYAGLADDAETETYPALQGFSAASIKGTGMLGIGTISDGTLQGGVERQDEPTARMMILGIQHQAMAALTSEGKQVIKNAINYLLKTNMEEVDDCSNYFIGGTVGHEQEWHTASNWSSTKVPDASTKARIMAPVTISTTVHVAQVDIAVDGKSIHYDSGNTDCSGSVTIAPTGALIVDGQVRRTTNGRLFTEDELQPTTPADLTILSSSEAQGALIFDNNDGETQATVEMYSPSFWEVMEGTNKKKSYWSYVGVPIQDVPVGEYFYGAVTYLYDETSGWIRKRIGSEFHAFEGIGLSLPEGHKETFYGTLASTETKEITLTKTTGVGEGDNLIGNSWTAPIQIGNFDASDFGSATATVYVYNTGRDEQASGSQGSSSYGGSGSTTAGQWITVPISSAKEGGYTGLKVIPAMNAFQVTTSSETTLTLDYDKLVRDVTIATDNLTQPMRAPKRSPAKAQNGIEAMMCVRMSGEKTHADVWLQQDERFSNEFDNGWEATYVECDNRSPQLYANSEIGKMAFLAKPDIEGTILGIAPSRDGNEYLFTFHYVGDEEFYLNDLKLKQSVLISEEESYSFMYEDGDTNRFYISRTRIDAPQMPTGVENTHGDAVKARKFIYNDKLYIMLNGRVYSAEGQLVK